MKKFGIWVSLLILLLTFAQPYLVYAEEEADDSATQQSSGIIGGQMDAYYEDSDNKPGLFERSISDLLIGAANFLIESFGMKDVTLLVFNENLSPTEDGFMQGSGSQDTAYMGVFSEGMMNAINALYTSFERFMPYPVVIAMLLLAVLMLWNSMNADNRSKWKDYLTAFLVGLLSIRFGHYLWLFVSSVTQTFTDLILSTMVDNGIEPNLFLNMIWGNGAEGYGKMVEYRGFVVAVLVLLAAVMTAILNYQYTMRTIMLMILVSVFVPVAVLSIFPKYRQSLQIWWDLFMSYMLMPVAHALALGLFFLLLRFSSDGVSNWIIVAYLFGFSSIQGMVSKLWGGQDQGQSRAGSMLGLGSMMALGRMFTPRGGSKGSKAKGLAAGAASSGGSQSMEEGTGALASGEMGENDQPAYAGRAVAGGAKPTWKRTAQTGGRMAGLALQHGSRAVGGVAGTSIGLMAGNPLMGAVAGAKLGGMVGAGAVAAAKGSLVAGKGIARGIQHIQQKNNATEPSGPSLEGNEAGNLSEDRPPMAPVSRGSVSGQVGSVPSLEQGAPHIFPRISRNETPSHPQPSEKAGSIPSSPNFSAPGPITGSAPAPATPPAPLPSSPERGHVPSIPAAWGNDLPEPPPDVIPQHNAPVDIPRSSAPESGGNPAPYPSNSGSRRSTNSQATPVDRQSKSEHPPSSRISQPDATPSPGVHRP